MGSQPSPSIPDPDIRRILDALRWLVRELRPAAAAGPVEAGLSAAQAFVLHLLQNRPGLSLGQLAEATATHPSSVSVVVAKLAARGLLTKEPADQDARRLEVRLTPAGRRLTGRLPEPYQEVLLRNLEALDPARRALLAELLARISGCPAGAPPMFFEEENGD